MPNIESAKYQLLNECQIKEENSVKQWLSKHKWAILGGIFALSSNVAYTFYGLFIKQFDVNFVDTLFVRSLIQTILVSFYIVITQKNFFPRFENGEEKWFICKKYFILILQVRFSKKCFFPNIYWKAVFITPSRTSYSTLDFTTF